MLVALLLTVSISAQVEMKVVIEHFTNTKCGVCANKNPALYSTLEDYPQVMHIAYHPSSPYSTCIFNQHNPIQNDARALHYDVYGATPRAVIQGDVLPIQSPMVMVSDIESKLGMVSDFKVTITNSVVSGDEFKVNFNVELVSGEGNKEITVYVALAEEEVNYNAPNGEDLHHDVFRMMVRQDNLVLNKVGDSEGDEVSYTMDPEWVSDQIFAYIIIQDPDTKEVLQSGSTLTSVSSVSNGSITESDLILYPNPVSNQIYVQPEFANKIEKIQLYSLVGSIVREFSPNSDIMVSDIPDGIYFARIITNDNQVLVERILIGR